MRKEIRDRHYLKTIGLIVVAVLTVVLVLLLFIGYQKEQKHIRYMENLADEAKPYEKEARTIRQDIKNKKQLLAETSDMAGVIICYQLQTLENWKQVQSIMSNYDFKATVIISAESQLLDKDSLFHEIGAAGWDVMLEGNPGDEAVMRQADILKTELTEYGITCSNTWFLPDGAYSDKNINTITQCGYQGFSQMSDYGSNISSGTLNDETFYYEHVPVFDDNNQLQPSLDLVIKEKKMIAININMNFYKNSSETKTIGEDTVRNALDKVKNGKEQNLFVVKTVSEVEEYYHERRQTAEESLQDYNEYVQLQNAKLQELQKKIDEIYSHWDKY